jgi:hypothetical protein
MDSTEQSKNIANLRKNVIMSCSEILAKRTGPEENPAKGQIQGDDLVIIVSICQQPLKMHFLSLRFLIILRAAQ